MKGFVATVSATGTKTDTPLIETPQSISVVTADQIDAQGAQSLGQVLRYTAGVSGETFGPDTRCYGLQMRGFISWDQSFYKDGMQLRAPAFANFMCTDPYGAERIEVLRGPASVLYGQNDPGGIINYVSKRPLDEPFREIEVELGNFNHRGVKFDLSGPLTKDGTLTYRLTGRGFDSDTQVDFVEEDRIFIAPAVTWRPNADTSLTVLGHYQRDDSGWTLQFNPAEGTVLDNPRGKIPRSRFIGEPDFDELLTTTATIGYLFEHKINETWTVRQNARYAYLHNEQRDVYGTGFDANGDYTRMADFGVASLDGLTIDNQAQAKFRTGALSHTLLAGVDAKYNRFSDRGGAQSLDNLYPNAKFDIFNPRYGLPISIGDLPLYQDDTVTQRQIGVYVQDQIKIGRWALMVGGRQDWVETKTDDRLGNSRSDQDDSAFTGRAGLVYLFDNGVAPYVSYSESFVPVLTPNPNGVPFEPETGRQYEVGLKYQPPGWNAFITVAAFDLTRENVIRYMGQTPIQTGEIQSRGIEIEGVASLKSGLDLRAQYTFTDAEIVVGDNPGNTPYGIPRHRASLWADYTFQYGPLAGFGLGGGVRYIGTTQGGDANTFEVPAVTLADAALHYEWDNYRLQINALNVFDKDYVASCFSFENGCYFGEGRTILATLRYRW